MNVSRQSFLVMGLMRSGVAVVEKIISLGGKCFIMDDGHSDEIEKNITECERLGATLIESEDVDRFMPFIDVFVLSPAIPLDNPVVIKGKINKKRIIGELEFGSTFCYGCIIGVTGTNGKTTTCNLMYNVLSRSGQETVLVGNVGTPLTERLDVITQNTLVVTEVSSFQLETTSFFCPHIAVILNITPDHLSRHYNMQNYIYLKGKILANLRESEYAVLNYDDTVVKSFASKTRAKVYYFSLREKVNGAYLDGDKIMFCDEFIMDKNDLKLEGAHNLANVLATVITMKLLHLTSEDIKTGVAEFVGIEHRIELIKEKEDIKYYNDSKSTNIDSTVKAIETIDVPTVLILGGQDKGLDYKPLFNKILERGVVHAVLMGETRYKMLDCAKSVGFNNVTLTQDFDKAVMIAKLQCPKGGAVVLSPATSSFDMFKDYEERGRKFVEIVEKLT